MQQEICNKKLSSNDKKSEKVVQSVFLHDSNVTHTTSSSKQQSSMDEWFDVESEVK